MKKITDADLETQLLSGDLNAFDEIYRRYYKFVLGVAVSLLKDTAVAKDVVQNTFVKFYESICDNKVTKSSTNVLSIKPLLRSMVYNASMDVFRKRKKVEFVSVENDTHLESLLFLCGDEKFDLSRMEVNEMKEVHKEVAHAVSKLPAKQRLVIKLRFESGLSFLEISELEGSSINTWTGRMRYALRNLRTELNIAMKAKKG